MADETQFRFDGTGWTVAFDRLSGPFKESLARRMATSGGRLLRDAAQSNAAVAANKEGVDIRGLLSRSVYLAFDTDTDKERLIRYTISWNAKQAPHGHLIEFGHWQNYVTYKAPDGNWYSRKDRPLDTPRWVAARPFLRPTFDSYGNTAIRVMLARGQEEFPKLIAEMVAQ